jgi:hypothetical protein
MEIKAMAKDLIWPRRQKSASTVARFEAGDELKERTIDAMRAALEKAGVEFIDEDGGGHGVRPKPKKTKRKPK